MEVNPRNRPQFDAIQEAKENTDRCKVTRNTWYKPPRAWRAEDSRQDATLYRVSTWDAEWEEFSPQEGIPSIVQGFAGLRQAIRELRRLGYAACRGDSAVLIERLDPGSSGS